jgi:hypothetical protein
MLFASTRTIIEKELLLEKQNPFHTTMQPHARDLVARVVRFTSTSFFLSLSSSFELEGVFSLSTTVAARLRVVVALFAFP